MIWLMSLMCEALASLHFAICYLLHKYLKFGNLSTRLTQTFWSDRKMADSRNILETRRQVSLAGMTINCSFILFLSQYFLWKKGCRWRDSECCATFRKYQPEYVGEPLFYLLTNNNVEKFIGIFKCRQKNITGTRFDWNKFLELSFYKIAYLFYV